MGLGLGVGVGGGGEEEGCDSAKQTLRPCSITTPWCVARAGDEAANLRGLHNSDIIPSVHPRQCGGEEVAVRRLVSIKHRHHFHVRWGCILAIDLLQAAVQVGRLGVGLVLALVPVKGYRSYKGDLFEQEYEVPAYRKHAWQ